MKGNTRLGNKMDARAIGIFDSGIRRVDSFKGIARNPSK